MTENRSASIDQGSPATGDDSAGGAEAADPTVAEVTVAEVAVAEAPGGDGDVHPADLGTRQIDVSKLPGPDSEGGPSEAPTLRIDRSRSFVRPDDEGASDDDEASDGEQGSDGESDSGPGESGAVASAPEAGASGSDDSGSEASGSDDSESDDSESDDSESDSRPTGFGGPHPLDAAQDVLDRLGARMRAQVLGRDEVIDLVLVALLADGHVLLEDFPGSGKTTLAKSLGASIIDDRADHADGAIASFRRIQFTPDLLPSDVTGVSIFDATTHRFEFRHGPLFAHVVLADEINRTSPKVQSAMLEAMAEKQVTVDNVTYPLDPLFFVIATQNPLDLAGTYPLPVAQLDRFLFKIRMDHIDRESELAVLETWQTRRDTERPDLPKVTRDEVIEARAVIDRHVTIDDRVKEALVDVARFVRDDERVAQGCSTRSLVLILPALQARAALSGRDYVASDDLAHLVPRVLGHRIELAPGLSDVDEVIDEALARSVEGLSRSTLSKSKGSRPRRFWGSRGQ